MSKMTRLTLSTVLVLLEMLAQLRLEKIVKLRSFGGRVHLNGRADWRETLHRGTTYFVHLVLQHNKLA